ncbi:MAG: PBSX family phage terminase large subunit [Ruminococcus sp.]|jgi:PBSX family phage terminase large subunit|nr:PBSX family phage terminase large subunit [Ruminococcus sp.]
MTFNSLSPKQKLIFTWVYSERNKGKRGIIADGAIRTGKTVCMACSYILWAMRGFSGKNFGICGKTIRSAERNILRPLEEVRDITKYYRLQYRRSDSLLIITEKKSGKSNNFYVFGGRDDSSYMLIQGITLSGVMFDEAALMPESFIEQACARIISEPSAKLWFNCNPDSKHSYFYKSWIEKADEKDLLRVTMLMKDNPILTKKQIEDADKLYSGVFRERYILGRWVNAEGIIYREFADEPRKFCGTPDSSEIIFANIGVDFGGNGSAHAMVLTGFTKNYGKAVVLAENYIREQITPSRLEAELKAFALLSKSICKTFDIYCDSAEQVLIRGIKSAFVKERLPFEIKNAKKTSILGRISFVNMLLSMGKLIIHERCKHLIDALSSAVWDDTGKRLDNGSTNIDSLDAFEYSIEPVMNYLL